MDLGDIGELRSDGELQVWRDVGSEFHGPVEGEVGSTAYGVVGAAFHIVADYGRMAPLAVGRGIRRLTVLSRDVQGKEEQDDCCDMTECAIPDHDDLADIIKKAVQRYAFCPTEKPFCREKEQF